MKSITRLVLMLLILVVVGVANAAYDIQWTSGPNHPTYRKGGAIGIFEGSVISAAGCEFPWAESAVPYSHTPGAANWVQLPSMPVGRAYTNGIEVGNAFYVCGGRKAEYDGFWTKREVYKLYRNAQNQLVWTQMASMIEDRGYSFGIGRVGTKIIVAGGNKQYPGQEQVTPTSTMNQAEYFDTANTISGWHSLPPIPGYSRCSSAGVGLGDKFYLFGGMHMIINSDGTSTYLRMNEALVFDTTTNQWSSIQNMPEGRSGAHAMVYNDRYIIIIGGCTEVIMPPPGQIGWYNDKVIMYDTVTNTYKTMPTRMPYATGDIRAVLINNKIYAIGGENIDTDHSNTDNHLRIGEIVTLPDTVPPVGNISINGGASYTNTTAVTLNPYAEDDDSGMGFMRFSNDGSTWSAWMDYATTAPWTLTSGSGLKMVYAQYKDIADNVSSTYLTAITLDGIRPSGTISINSAAQYATNPSVILTLSATDSGGSGVSQMRFSNDNSTWSTWEAYVTNKAWTLSAGDGTKTVYVQYKDGAGNSSFSINDTIVLDTGVPTGTISINSDAQYTKTTSVTLSISATDGSGSGVYQMRFSNDVSTWSTWESYEASKAWTLTAVSGTKTVYVQYKDNAGNTSASYSDSIILDTQIPTSGTAVSPANANTVPIEVTYTGAGDSGGSGLKEVRLYYKKEQSGTWTDTGLTSTGTSGSFNFTPGDGAGSYYFDLVAEDNAGNKSASASGDGDTSTLYSLSGGVQGSITLRDWTGTVEGIPAVIDIRDGTGTTLETKNVSLNASGGFNFSTALTGAYTLVAKAGHWLAKAMPLTITGGTDTVDFTLINGDCNGDNGIDEIDYAMLSNAWYQAVGDPAYNADADLNGDGGVDEIDYAILSNVWYTAGD